MNKELKKLTLEDIKRSGLTEADFKKMKLVPCDEDEASAVLNSSFCTFGYAIPYFDIKGETIDCVRFRFLEDLLDKNNKIVKYSQPKGTEPRLYFPPCINWQKICDDPSITITITEGEKKAYKACKSGIPTIGLGGVWSYRSNKLRKDLIDDFKNINNKDRLVILCFDSDIKTNPSVMNALYGLAEQMEFIGAKVKIKYLPDSPYKKIGLDDYLLEHNKFDFENIPNEDPLHPELRIMNNKLAVVPVGSKVFILREEADPNFLDNKVISLYKSSDMATYYANIKIPVNVDGSIKKKSAYKIWLESCLRRTLKGIVFDPDDDPDGYYNLYTGFSVQPKKGTCKLFKKHMLQNISQGDRNIYNYLMAWMADVVQNPSKKPGVAIVLRGRQGTGKGIFVNIFGQLFGQHFIRLDNSEQLLGKFNFHLKDKLVVFADESFWAGDKNSEGKLKGLITEPTLSIEGKYKDLFEIKNHTHILIASNNDWTNPAGLEERRFCVLDVGEKHTQDHQYFKAIIDEMNSGGLEALLYDLQNHDLSNINLRDIPKTKALLEQKIHSMDSVEQFCFNLLNEGSLDDKGNWGTNQDNGRISCEMLMGKYLSSSKDIGENRRSAQTQFGIKLAKLFPKVIKKRIYNKHLNKQTPVYIFPDLKSCRANFEKLIGMTINWGSINI